MRVQKHIKLNLHSEFRMHNIQIILLVCFVKRCNNKTIDRTQLNAVVLFYKIIEQ
jgi:hypothetical protein